MTENHAGPLHQAIVLVGARRSTLVIAMLLRSAKTSIMTISGAALVRVVLDSVECVTTASTGIKVCSKARGKECVVPSL